MAQDSHCSVAEDSGFMGNVTVSMGDWFPEFQRIAQKDRVISHKTWFFVKKILSKCDT